MDDDEHARFVVLLVVGYVVVVLLRALVLIEPLSRALATVTDLEAYDFEKVGYKILRACCLATQPSGGRRVVVPQHEPRR